MNITYERSNGEVFLFSVPDDVMKYFTGPEIDSKTCVALLEQLVEHGRVEVPGSSEKEISPPSPSPLPSFPITTELQPPTTNTSSPSSPHSFLTSPHQGTTASPNYTFSPETSTSDDTGASYSWTTEGSRMLINLRMEMDNEFRSGRKCHEVLWEKVKSKLEEGGVKGKTVYQLANRWDNLKETYKNVKDYNYKTGRARKDFLFLEEFDDFMGERASIKPAFVLDTLSASIVQDLRPLEQTIERKRRKRTWADVERKAKRIESLLEEIAKSTRECKELIEKHHRERMALFDRFLDLYEKSLNVPPKN